MGHRKWITLTLATVISLLFILVVLVTAIDWVTFDRNFYKQQYGKLNNHVVLEMEREELLRVTWELLDYIRGERDELHTIDAEIAGRRQQMFNQREMDHMVDVRELFHTAYVVRDSSLLILFLAGVLLYYLSGKNPLPSLVKSYLLVCGLLLAASGLLYLLMQTDFTRYWDQFHFIFFDNDLWLLDPNTDRLIVMVPEPFFYSAVTRVLLYTAAGIALPAAGCLYCLTRWHYTHGKTKGLHKR